jgi:hypothetical protein
MEVIALLTLIPLGGFLLLMLAITVSMIASFLTDRGDKRQHQREDLWSMLGDPRDRP